MPGLSPLAALVRRHDRDRYQTALFAPAGRRKALFALYAFNYEIARVREAVTQPMLGQIRLQWWREIVAAAFAGVAPRPHEVAEPLTAVIRDVMPTRAHFDRMIDTRERDLADEPPASLAALEVYAEGTAATLLNLALEVLGVTEPAAGAAAREIGIGYALSWPPAGAAVSCAHRALVISPPISPHAPGSIRRIMPACAIPPALRAAAAEIAEAAVGHLRAARRYRREVPRSARAAMLGAIVADRFLARLNRAGFNPFAPELVIPDPLQSWRLAAAALRGRF